MKPLLPLTLLALLAFAACTADTDAPSATSGLQPIALGTLNVTGGADTRANPYNGTTLADGYQLTLTAAADGQSSTGTYTYDATAGTWAATTPAYWQNSSDEHTLTLATTPTPAPAYPAAYTADNWPTYDLLTATLTNVTPTATSINTTLTHARAQLCVTLTPGDGHTDTSITGATVSATAGGNSVTFYHQPTENAYYALFDPADTPTGITIAIGSGTYTYTPAFTLTANTCHILALTVNKAGVTASSVTIEAWTDVAATSTENIDLTGCTVIRNTAGNLSATQLTGKVMIVGTINQSDINLIGRNKNNITHLYIKASPSGEPEPSIPDNWVEGSSSLKEVTLPDGLTYIGHTAFADCTSLTSITLPDGLTSISDNAFFGCSSLTSITLPEGVTSIGGYAFANSGLTSITLPEGVTSIGGFAFCDCSSLASVCLLGTSPPTTDGSFVGTPSTKSLFRPKMTTFKAWGSTTWANVYYNFDYTLCPNPTEEDYYTPGYYQNSY